MTHLSLMMKEKKQAKSLTVVDVNRLTGQKEREGDERNETDLTAVRKRPR